MFPSSWGPLGLRGFWNDSGMKEPPSGKPGVRAGPASEGMQAAGFVTDGETEWPARECLSHRATRPQRDVGTRTSPRGTRLVTEHVDCSGLTPGGWKCGAFVAISQQTVPRRGVGALITQCGGREGPAEWGVGWGSTGGGWLTAFPRSPGNSRDHLERAEPGLRDGHFWHLT